MAKVSISEQQKPTVLSNKGKSYSQASSISKEATFGKGYSYFKIVVTVVKSSIQQLCCLNLKLSTSQLIIDFLQAKLKLLYDLYLFCLEIST